jgi:TonB family protein
MLYAAVIFALLVPPPPPHVTPTPEMTTCPSTQVAVTHAVAPDVTGIPISHTMSAEVLVTVNPDGAVKGAAVQKSSGVLAVDNAVVRAARASSYQPRTEDCGPVQGTYVFRADFKPNSQ